MQVFGEVKDGMGLFDLPTLAREGTRATLRLLVCHIGAGLMRRRHMIAAGSARCVSEVSGAVACDRGRLPTMRRARFGGVRLDGRIVGCDETSLRLKPSRGKAHGRWRQPRVLKRRVPTSALAPPCPACWLHRHWEKSH